MCYKLADGQAVDTARDLNFEERNFIQKMMIYAHLKMGLEEFRNRWRRPGNPVWTGPSVLDCPTPAVKILLDLEHRIQQRRNT